VANIKSEIKFKIKEKANKTEGVESRPLFEMEYKEGENIRSKLWKPGIDIQGKWRRAIDKGTDVLSDQENEDNYEYINYGLKEVFNTLHIANIGREFQLIPPGQGVDVLNDLIQGKEILNLGNGGF